MLVQLESTLYGVSSKALPLIHNWSSANYSTIEFLSQVEQLGRTAMAHMEVTNAHLRLLNNLSRWSNFAETWFTSHLSSSTNASARLGITELVDNTMADDSVADNKEGGGP